jgi:hypothetical protein
MLSLGAWRSVPERGTRQLEAPPALVNAPSPVVIRRTYSIVRVRGRTIVLRNICGPAQMITSSKHAKPLAGTEGQHK